MYFTGFADEAGPTVATQIQATQELGWRFIEARNVNGKNIHDLSDAEFEEAGAKLAAAGVGINCFGSTIANWGKQIAEPFASSLAEAKRAIPRMQRLGTKLVRIMSFAVRKEADGADAADQMEAERFRRVRELVALFTDAGITPVHENCMNYGGMSWQHTLRLIENVPGLKLAFDTGNPVFTDDRGKAPPYPKQSAWEFYSRVKEHIAYVHIKDGVWDYQANKPVFTHANEGQGSVFAILKDLLAGGYDGGLSIEPHLAVVFHDATVQSEAAAKFANYVEYGRRFMRLVEQIQADLRTEGKLR
ncbi:MAG: sugar phosphate isomerase/epimerase family protein [Lentisphaeria bacterium]|jgi:sugar phosphate isomerase/epimerase